MSINIYLSCYMSTNVINNLPYSKVDARTERVKYDIQGLKCVLSNV